MSLLVAPLLPVGAVALLVLLLLRVQRASSADQRRATAIGAVLICLCFCAAPLVAARWPVIVPTPAASVPAARTRPPAAPTQPEKASDDPAQNLAPTPGAPAPRAASQNAMSRFAASVRRAVASGCLRVIPAAGACCVGAWFVGALIWGERLRTSGAKASERVQSECAYDVLIVSRLTIPACLGGLRPVVLLPEGADDWNRETLVAVLRHEEAHIRHRDHLWNSVAFLLCALQWFNPFVWLLLSRLRLESERMADDAVLAQGLAPHAYTKTLLQFQPVPSSHPASRVPIVAQPLVRKSGLAIRLEAILTQNRRSMMTRKQFAMTLLSAFVLGASASGVALSQTAVRRMIAVSPAVSPAVPPIAPPADTAPERVPTAVAVRPPLHARKMELVQVGVKDGNRPAVVWDAKGDLVPPAQVIAHYWRPNDVDPSGYVARYRHIVFRVQAEPGDLEPDAGVGSPSDGLGYNMPRFASFGYASCDFLMTKGGWHYFVDHFSVEPHPENGVRPPVKDFGIYHLPRTNMGVSVMLGVWKDRGPLTKDPGISDYRIARVENTSQLPKGFDLEKRSPIWSKVDFIDQVTPDEGTDKYVVTLRNGKTLPENLMEGSFGSGYGDDRKSLRETYYIGAAPDAIAEIRRFMRANSVEMDLTNVPLSPRVSS